MVTEWIILADYVEFTSGRLYLMGGGWDRVTINHPARIHNCGIATAFRIDWDATGTQHDVTLRVWAAASDQSLAELQAVLELGNGTEPEPGTSQLAQLALNLSIEFEEQGLHYVSTVIDGHEDRRYPFFVSLGAAIPD